MSRIRILGASLIVLAASVGAAAAADVPVTEPPATSPVYSPTSAFNWSGPYAGLIGGYNWGSASTASGSVSTKGFGGGVYAGYNFMPGGGNFLLGVEGDANLDREKGSVGGLTVSRPWGGSLRARAGLAFDRFLIYGTGGLAFGEVKAKNTDGTSDSATKTGWTLGGGVEAAITDHMTARLEYRYTDLGTANLTTTGAGAVDSKSSAVLLGVGWKF